jgi:hypothetical protein
MDWVLIAWICGVVVSFWVGIRVGHALGYRRGHHKAHEEYDTKD